MNYFPLLLMHMIREEILHFCIAKYRGNVGQRYLCICGLELAVYRSPESLPLRKPPLVCLPFRPVLC